jgi:hypothetical protein
MKYFTLLVLSLISLFASCNALNSITNVDYKLESGLYQPLFINFSVDNIFKNPYDQGDIKIDALIECPNKETLILPCFYLSEKDKVSNWQARFTPRIQGLYTFKIQVTQNEKEILSENKQFNIIPSEAKGLLSFDKTNPYFLKYDNGEKFRGLGLNVGWANEPKWDTREKYTFDRFFDAMHENQANFLRMWICPWNFPINWTPVVKYQMLTEEFTNWNNILSHSNGLNISQGTTPVTQADIGQLIKTTDTDENMVYQFDSVRAVKLMIYYKGAINKEDIQILSSADNTNYTKVITELSESWESAEGWRRIFLFSFGSISQPANYIKLVFKSSLKKENIRFSGIQFRYGKEISRLDCDGFSHYSNKNSEKLDSLFNQALSKDIHMILCLGYHGQFNPIMDSWGVNDEWQRNPYNIKNGGPCEKPADFFSNEIAKKHYKNYLRYFVARWGYSPVIVSWEFWNEIDIAMRNHNIPEADIVGWHKEMSDYLNSVDPYGHIITTSLSGGDMPDLWNLKNINLTQIHRYQVSNQFVQQTVDFINKYNKPHIIGEYAISWKGPENDFSNEQYEDEFHNGLWRGLFTPVAMLPLSWWWDFHYDKNQYFHFKPLASVIEVMKKQKSGFSPLKLEKQKEFDLLGLSSDSLYIIWIKKMGNLTKLSTSFSISKSGKFFVKKLNTRTNEWKDLEGISSLDNKITLKTIDLAEEKDIVLLIGRVE